MSELPIFGARDTFAEAALRMGSIGKRGVSQDTATVEQVAALWQIAFELNRIASVLEEVHK